MPKQKRAYRANFNQHLKEKNFQEKGEGLAKLFKLDNRVKRFKFRLEQGQINKNDHWQGYIEFNRLTDLLAFKNKYSLSFVEKTLASRENNENYIDKDKGTLFFFDREEAINQTNIEKKETTNNRDLEYVPKSYKKQWIDLEEKIVSKKYQSLADVHTDYPYLVIHHDKKIQSLILKYNKVNHFKLQPAEVIWIYGTSGVGKSCYTEQLLKKKGYKGTEISCLKGDLADALWFELSDENKKVLVLEEVRVEWPKHNSLINWIDKKTYLPIKGSQIRNNFELIVINSLLNPYDCYKCLPRENIIEPLRRIYSGTVLRLELGDNHKELQDMLKRNKIDFLNFKFKLQPKVIDMTKKIPDILKDSVI